MNILVTEADDFSSHALKILNDIGSVRQMNLSAGPELLKAVANCEILWVRLRNYIGADVLNAAKRLQWIVSPTTGLNHIDLAMAEKLGIRILSLQGEVDFLKEIRATAEFTIGLMLALLRQLPQATASVENGIWNRDLFRGRELYQQPVGLIGFGRLGKIVAEYLRSFGSNVMVCDPAFSQVDMEGVELVSLEKLLRSSKLVSLHASYKPGNESFFDASCFDLMLPGSWFINTARGELVEEAALLQALESGKLAGAALDVLASEVSLNAGSHPLVKFARKSNKLIITPHLGGCTYESMERVEHFMAEKLQKALACADSW